MDLRLKTRGSNDLGGAMFKGEHGNKLLSHFLWKFRLPDLTKGGEKEQDA